jgi:hypothetical protein
MPGTSRWTLVALALAILLAGGAQADPESVSVTGDLEVEIADDVLLSPSEASDGSGSGVSSYRLHREGGPEGAVDVAVSGTSYTDRNTSSGASYAYTVHTLDAVGNESGASNVVSLTLGGKSGGPKGGGDSGSGGGQGGGKGKKK